MEFLHEDQYFTCSCGLKPAKMSSTQSIMLYDKKHYYLTKQSTASSHIGDFACRWTVVLAGLVIGLGVVTGGAALLVFGAAVLASGLMCGALFAGARKWINSKETVTILHIELLTEQAVMTCPVGGQVTVAPGIDCWWKAVIYTARNTGYAFLEGWFLGKMAGGGGSALFGAKNVATVGQFAKNFLFLQGTARGFAAADQIVFEGMLRNGLSFGDAVKEHAIPGLTAFEQPFINIYKKLNGEVKYPDGTTVPLNWQDFYGAGMSAFGTACSVKASLSHPNIPKATWNQIKETAGKIKGKLNGKAYELNTPAAQGDVRKAEIVRKIEHGEKIADIIQEAKQLTWLDNVEHAVIKINGERFLVSGGRHGIILPGNTELLYGHTHPPVGSGQLNGPSIGDRVAIGAENLNQSKQYVFHDGQRTTIHRGDMTGQYDVTTSDY